jgi:GT2 family glycosyltransferase
VESPSAFISYAHEDRALATWLSVELEAAKVRVFRDEQFLKAGDRLSSVLKDAVTSADVFLLIASANGLSSDWTMREFKWAKIANRRVIPIYPKGFAASNRWPELIGLLYLEVTKSFGPVVEGVLGAFPGCSGKVASLAAALKRGGIDIGLCAEILRSVASAVQRHTETDTWVKRFSLDDCFLWTASSGASVIADTHIFISPNHPEDFSEVERREGQELESSKGRTSRIAVLRKSLAEIGQRLLESVPGVILQPPETPIEAFNRCKGKVAPVDHKRLFNFLHLVDDLIGTRASASLPDLLDRVQTGCVYSEEPHHTNSKQFASIFNLVRREASPSLSVVVTTHGQNRTIYSCLESLLAQTQRADEVIVVEDTPRTRFTDLESRFGVDHICLPDNGSHTGMGHRAKCRLRGTKMAGCELILYLDGDTIISPGLVEQVIDWWRDRNESDGCLSLLAPELEIQPPEQPEEVTYDWVSSIVGTPAASALGLYSMSGAGILRSWHDSPTGSSFTRPGVGDSLSWRNVRSRCWSTNRKDVIEVGNWDDAYEGWGTEDTDLAYRLHLYRGMRVRILARRGAYAVHIAHHFDYEDRAHEHARNEARFIMKYPELEVERMALARRLGIAQLVEYHLRSLRERG